MNAKHVSKLFGCTEAQAKAQYSKNANQLGEMAAKARATGKKLNGYTAEQLESKSAKMRELSK